MSDSRLRLRRTILWQGTVILLPVLVLAGVGFYALKQDRTAVTEEARQRAGEIARDLSERLGRQITSQLSICEATGNMWAGDGIIGGSVHWPGHSPLTSEGAATYQKLLREWEANYPDHRPADVFPIHASFSETGEIELPKDYPDPPAPAPWLTEMSPEQMSRWREAAPHLNSAETSAVRGVLQEFFDSDLPKSAKANAEFSLLLLDLNDATPVARVQQLIRFASRHWSEFSEGGLPLSSLAMNRALREASNVGLTEELFEALNTAQVFGGNSSFLSAQLLAEVERLAERHSPEVRKAVSQLRLRWDSQERLRGLARRVQQMLQPIHFLTTNLWFDFAGQRWFAILDPGESQVMTATHGQPITLTNRVTNLRLFPGSVVRRAADLALSLSWQSIPAYFGTELSVEGERVVFPVPRNQQPMLLARGEGRLSLPGVMLLNDHLDPPRRGAEFETLPSQPRFSLAISLADPESLYAQARQRARVFGALLLAAATLAVLGLVRMLQALVRQQRLNEMKSNFVSSVSHELRAPIASVRLMAEGLESGRIHDEQKRHAYFKFIVQECRRLTSLVENVLDFSRIEQGHKEYEFAPTEIVTLVEETVKLMRTYAEEKKITLANATDNLQLSTCHLQLLADGRALQQALVNLIDNALKHSLPGSTVTIGLELTTDREAQSRITNHASRLHLWVADHGDGIPSDEHDRIFERFYRRGSELRRETQGVGIGLSIVKHIVEAHGGRVLVRSAVGEGSRFTIELPLQNSGPNHELD